MNVWKPRIRIRYAVALASGQRVSVLWACTSNATEHNRKVEGIGSTPAMAYADWVPRFESEQRRARTERERKLNAGRVHTKGWQ